MLKFPEIFFNHKKIQRNFLNDIGLNKAFKKQILEIKFL